MGMNYSFVLYCIPIVFGINYVYYYLFAMSSFYYVLTVETVDAEEEEDDHSVTVFNTLDQLKKYLVENLEQPLDMVVPDEGAFNVVILSKLLFYHVSWRKCKSDK